MKYLLILLLTLNLTFSFSQPKIGEENIKTSTIFMIDKSWSPRGATKFKADETSYLQITDDYFVLSERTRGESEYFEGNIETMIETNRGVHFWVKFRGRAIISCDIEFIDNDVKIHLYHSLGRYDKYYSGHIASTEEVKKLLEYIKK
tara:strand:- start:9088 stop:9528 length:441 start_codon:yes stop_codon:yes gene_type:complete